MASLVRGVQAVLGIVLNEELEAHFPAAIRVTALDIDARRMVFVPEVCASLPMHPATRTQAPLLPHIEFAPALSVAGPSYTKSGVASNPHTAPIL